MYRMIAQIASIEFKKSEQRVLASPQQEIVVNKKLIEELLKLVSHDF